DEYRRCALEDLVVRRPAVRVHLGPQTRNPREALLKQQAAGAELVVPRAMAWSPRNQEQAFLLGASGEDGRRAQNAGDESGVQHGLEHRTVRGARKAGFRRPE